MRTSAPEPPLYWRMSSWACSNGLCRAAFSRGGMLAFYTRKKASHSFMMALKPVVSVRA